MKSFLALLALFSLNMKPADVAYLLLEKDAAAITAPLHDALAGPDALTRATAARVIAVRDLKPLVADVRAALDHESDAVAAREELRTLALVGDEKDVDYALAAAAKWPASVDGDVALAIARRGGTEAVDIYLAKLTKLRTLPRNDFFRIALWGRPQAMVFTASRLLGTQDGPGWDAFLGVMEDAHVAVNPGVLAASLDSTSEPIRVESVWYIVREYAADPSKLPQLVRDAITKSRDVASLREDFGRELVRRMSGAPTPDTHRFDDWLESPEADDLLGHASDAVYNLLSENEYKARHNRCGMQPGACNMPDKRPVVRPRGKLIESIDVAPPALQLPGELPPGLADRLRTCSISWMGLLSVTVDTAGRLQTIEPRKDMNFGRCLKGVETMVRLSYAMNTSVLSPLSMGDVIVVHAGGDSVCLDEDPPSEEMAASLTHVSSGGKITAPVKIRSVEPIFPEHALKSMPAGSASLVILEAVITKHGCVRSVRPLRQSPFPDVNGAAIFAMSQWKFSPGRLNGKPVDVIYNLTINFKR